jgi:UDP-N-acetylmuramyl pentapeptide phosphotransferase/UDP-N-acetylglucosamine-1-phosphate transferase
MHQNEPISGLIPFIKGLVAGTLLVGAFSAPYGILVQVFLFIIAAAIFLDDVLSKGRPQHLLTFLIAMAIGIAIGVGFAIAQLVNISLVLAFVLMTVVYLYEFMSYREGKRVRSGVANLLSR